MSNSVPQRGPAYAARAALGGAQISVRELARRTGRSHAYWSKRLTEHQSMTVADLEVIAEHTGVTVADLVSAA